MGLLWLHYAQVVEMSKNPNWLYPLCQSAINTPRSVESCTISTAFTTETVLRGQIYT